MQRIKTIHPDEKIKAVKKITVITEDNMNPHLNSMQYFADGLPGIMFFDSNNDIFLRNEKKLSPLFFYGQTVRPIEINTIGPFKAIIFHLYSHTTRALFDIEAHELTDRCIDYDLLIGNKASDLSCRLQDLNSTQAQISLVYQSLQKKLFEIKSTVSCSLSFAVESMIQTNGDILLTSLQDELKVTERTFERKFLQHVGVSPNLFKRICKFNTVLQALETGAYGTLTDVAYSHGFADQSHFNRTFREFTGFTPGEYLKILQAVRGA